MSYNTRRGANFGGAAGSNPPNPNAALNVGTRRPVVTNNFVSGGQLPAQKATPVVQPPQQVQRQQQQQQAAQQQQTGIQFRNQQQQQQVKPPVAGQAKPAGQQQGFAASPLATPTKAAVKQESSTPNLSSSISEDVSMDSTNGDKKKFWANKNKNKITKSEKLRRRNMRLSRILQPKNALMILNELVRNHTFNVVDYQSPDGIQYKATVLAEGTEHTGYAKSKIGAKSAAAENVLRYLIKQKKISAFAQDSDGDVKMDVSESGEATEEGSLPWQQVASFALYKLFCSWGETPNLMGMAGNTSLSGSTTSLNSNQPQQPKELKAAKKMPENAKDLNPIMLVNQMHPGAQYEELNKTGVPPNVIFNFKITVEGQTFYGSGSSKKIAKRMAAFEVAHKVLGVTYSPDVYSPMPMGVL